MWFGCVVLACLTASSAAAETSLYVSPNGNDQNPGTQQAPLASLAGAKDRARQVFSAEKALTIWFAQGIYRFDRPVRFGPEDSGTQQAPITYRAHPGAEVRFSGGQTITQWHPVSDQAVLNRLAPEARDQIKYADLSAQGISDYGRLGRRGAARGIPPGESSWVEAELFYNDTPMTLARWPNQGFRGVDQVHNDQRIQIDNNRLARWAAESDPWILAYWFHDWAELYEPIIGFEPENQILLRSADLTPAYGIDAGRTRWYAFNLLSELDQPGEYYLDRNNGRLYWWPPAEEGSTVLSLSAGIISTQDLSDITFHGFTLEATRTTAITIEGGANIRILACTIRNTGHRAVQVSGGTKHLVFGCDVYNTGTGGIHMSGGDRATLTPSGHNAENNHVHHYSRRKRTYMPAIRTDGVGGRIAHNLIHDGPHMALSAAGNDHLLEYNEIHNVVYESRDAGAFYVGRDFTQRGTVLRYNYWHQILGAAGSGGMTIYLDDQHSGHTIHGNLFESVANAVFIGGGVDNIVTNNLFLDCWPAAHLDNRGMGWQKASLLDTTWTFHRNLRAVPYQSQVWAQRYPTLPGILAEEGLGVPKRNVFRANISAGGIWDDINGATKRFQTIEDNLSFDDDPDWVRLIKDDAGHLVGLQYKDPGALEEIGFASLPIDKIGVYADEKRATWPVVHPVRPVQFPAPVPQAELPPDPLFTVARSAAAITIDGILNKQEWNGLQADNAMRLEAEVSGALVKPAAQAWLSHNGSTLHIGVRTALLETRDLGSVWGRSDAVELAFKAADDFYADTLVLRGYTEGTWETTDEPGTSQTAMERIARNVEYGAHTGDGQWSAEWSIPLKNLPIEPDAPLRFNLTVRRVAGQQWIMWRPTKSHSFAVESAGRLQLAP